MMYYTLSMESKKAILRENKINIPLTRLLKDCSDVEFFAIVLDMIIY